jgi:hypothetical protein
MRARMPMTREAREWSDADAIGSTSEVRWQKEQLGFRIDAFLRKCGWTHTSSTPGSLWLWTKLIDGHAFYVDRDTAVAMQKSLEPLDIDGDDDLGECG